MMKMPAAASPLNPFPWYEQMRAQASVFFDEGDGVWHVFGYDDVQRVLSDFANFSSERGRGGGGGANPLQMSIISLDPPRHRQLRSLVTQAFTPRAVARLESRIEAITRELLDAVAERGEMDVIAELAYPLPVIVIAELLGVPAEDREHFKLWSDAIVQGQRSAAGEAARAALGADWFMQMAQYFLRMVELRQQEPSDDLISGLIAAQVEGEHLSTQELLGFCVLLLVAGNETTTNLIGNAILSFDEHPEAMERLRQAPELLPSAVEETLRYRSPVQSMFRVTAREVELDGKTIPPEEWVVAWIGSANRDPAQFPEPDSFDVARTPNRHLAFGHGIHFCLGAPLARLEGRIALGAMLQRMRNIRCVPNAPLEVLDGNIVFGVRNLPITFERA
jgi:cytochrome P450